MPSGGGILGLTEPAVRRLQASSLRKLVVQLAPDRPVRRVICSRVVVRLQSAGIDPSRLKQLPKRRELTQ
jgi:hypothetical protein